MTQYLLAVHSYPSLTSGAQPPPAPGSEEIAQMYAAVDAFNSEVKESGAWVFAGGLLEPSVAATVRFADGSAQVSEGPYADVPEHLGGFWVIEAADLAAATALAGKASKACRLAVEVRPFQDEPPA